MHKLGSELELYLVTDPWLCRDLGIVETVRAAIAGGVTMVQLRDKEASTEQLIETAKALKQVMKGSGIPLIINDNIDVAIAVDADGVHIGQSDDAPLKARQTLGEGKIIGLSCETIDRVRSAPVDALNYLGIGPVFATPTKGDHSAPIGLDGLASLVKASPIPTVAIGGLKHQHCQSVFDAGVDGIAVVSAICGHRNPEAQARKFRELIEEIEH